MTGELHTDRAPVDASLELVERMICGATPGRQARAVAKSRPPERSTIEKALSLTALHVSRSSHSCQTGTRMIP